MNRLLAVNKPITEMSVEELVEHFLAMTPDELHTFYMSPEFDERFYHQHRVIVMTLLSNALVRLQIAAARNTKP